MRKRPERRFPGPAAGVWWVVALLAIYGIGFFVFYPTMPLIYDEVEYLEMGLALSEGQTCLATLDVGTAAIVCESPSIYLPGTSLLMAPFIAVFGWTGGFAVGYLALTVLTIATVVWIKMTGHNPIFALLVLMYPPLLVLARHAMSDVPAAALVAISLLLFWKGRDGSAWWWVASGFVAGGALLIRETALLAVAPFFVGAVVRYRWRVLPLVIGGIAGLGLRGLVNSIVYDDAAYTFPAGYSFSLANIPPNLALYGLAVLVFMPLGLVGVILYRGPQRPEVMVAFALGVGIYLLYGYNGSASGFARQLVLGPRYLIPLLPIMAMASAHTFTRIWRGRRRASASADHRMRVTVNSLGVLVLIGVAAVNPWAHLQADPHRQMRDTIMETIPEESVVAANTLAMSKYINRLHSDYLTFGRAGVTSEEMTRLLDRYGVVYSSILDRGDRGHWGLDQQITDRFLNETLGDQEVSVIREQEFPSVGTLRIHRVDPG